MTREEAIKKLESLKISLPAAKDEISEIIKLIETPWISVKNDLPCNHKEMIINADSLSPTTKKVLVYNKNKEIRVAWMLYRKDKGWVWDISACSQPLFFMFIPELPKE